MNPFFPNFPFRPPLKTIGFLMFSGGSKGNIGKKKVDKEDVDRNWLKWFLYIYFMKVLFVILAGFMNFLSPFIVVLR